MAQIDSGLHEILRMAGSRLGGSELALIADASPAPDLARVVEELRQGGTADRFSVDFLFG